ncbi:MAG: hypothetical protein EPO45_14310 [Sphingobium sp.]|nr:hypothetical protein [uncultured Sphingobium sp.]MBU0657216.1 hypothetical protein [Alphaproteobacteria bacterium]TAJ75523.1 MAG: hypothetical protein EPO45_14310 [Sphingobium sp.]MBU0774248.1 hypothetical protein [Alphaproteobacteria bacterium]MBU1257690.1 hypothetical protein [Alphaproteobacteria bacterium]MBU2016352.1 hypothetical protein [Alphaproteobacteria bacterium]
MSALLALAPQSALASGGVPLSPIGFSFSPSAPAPLKPDHPLYRRIALEQVADMPGVVGGKATLGLAGAAKRSSFEKALRETMNKLNMLATTNAEAKVRLSPRWIDMDAPFKISFSSRASVTMGWSLTRIDNGQLLFQRDITTAAQSKGGNGTDRMVGVGRVALMTNIASALNCVDRAAYGVARQDCALSPNFEYKAPTYIFMFLPG